MFSRLQPAPSGSSEVFNAGAGQTETRVRDLLQTASNQSDAVQVVLKGIQHKLSDLLNISEDIIDDTLDVRANGVDSLIEMEFRTWLAKELSATVPLKDFAKNLNQLSAKIVSLSTFTNFRSRDNGYYVDQWLPQSRVTCVNLT